MRKLVYSALAFSAALAVAFGANATASAEETAAPQATAAASAEAKSVVQDADFGLAGDTLTISNTEAEKIIVGTGKKAKDGSFTASAWDVYNVADGLVKIDLSKINKTKDAYLLVKADFELDSDAYVVKVPASDAIKGKYDKTTGKVDVTDAKGGKLDEDVAVNYRTESRFEVSDISTLDTYTYQMSGGVIYLSTAQAAAGDAAKEANVNLVLDKRPSKEVKVSIGKLANAPKVKANYVAGTITVPKNIVYSTQVNGAEATAPATSTGITLTLGKDIAATDSFAVDVQTPEDSAKKKLASKVGHYVFPAQDPTALDALDAYADAKVTEAKGKVTLEIENKAKIGDTENKDSYTFYWWQAGKTEKDKVKKTTVKAGAKAKLAGIATTAGIGVQRVGNSKKTEEAWAGNTVVYLAGTNTDDYGTPGQSSGNQAVVTKYAITKAGNKSAEITVDAEAAKDDEVTVTLSRALKKYDTIKVTKTGDDETVVKEVEAVGDGKTFTFTMPDYAVTVSVVENE